MTKMTRQHFKEFAKMVSEVNDKEMREYLTAKIGGVCEEMNDCFDWAKWEKACNEIRLNEPSDRG